MPGAGRCAQKKNIFKEFRSSVVPISLLSFLRFQFSLLFLIVLRFIQYRLFLLVLSPFFLRSFCVRFSINCFFSSVVFVISCFCVPCFVQVVSSVRTLFHFIVYCALLLYC